MTEIMCKIMRRIHTDRHMETGKPPGNYICAAEHVAVALRTRLRIGSMTLLLLAGLPLWRENAAAAAEGALNAAQRAVLEDIARGGDGAGWPGLSPEQAGHLTHKASWYLANYITHHLPDGLNADIEWTDHNRTAVGGYPDTGYTGLGDSAAWTGHYLAALALRYAVKREAQDLNRIHGVLDSLEMLTHVSGRDGHLARHAIPFSRLEEAAGPYRAYYRRYGGDLGDPYLGEEAFNGTYNNTAYAWLGNQQRDAFICVNFGLATTLAKVDDTSIRNKISSLIDRMVQRMKDDAVLGIWLIDDGHRGSIFEKPYVTPLMKAALLRTAATTNPQKWADEYAAAAAAAPTTFNDIEHDGYFVNNLDMNLIYSLNALENDPARKAKWEQAAGNKWAQTADHLQAHFAAVYLAATGNPSDPRAIAALQGELADFPPGPRFTYPVENDPTQTYAPYAHLIQDRPPSDFMWQRSPFKNNGGHSGPEEFPGIDLFLPYWMGRDLDAVPTPKRNMLLIK